MTTWDSACTTIDTCLLHGIREFVICAGARNAALVEVLARAEAAGIARIWRHFEERSAGFFALSIAAACSRRVRSGSAATLVGSVFDAARRAGYPSVQFTVDRALPSRSSR